VSDANPPETTGANHVVLVGAMGSGKTTIGVPLALALGRPFVDNDAQLLARTGSTAADLAARAGIDALHAAEAEALLSALAQSTPAVIAAAASTIVDAGVRHALGRAAFVVWVRASPNTLAARLARPSERPFAHVDPATLVAEQGRERDPRFEEVADLAVESDASPADVVVAGILRALPENVQANR
jgi:shikimate kinase